MAKLQKMANASGLTDYDVEKHNRNRNNYASPLQGQQMQLGYVKGRRRANFSNMSPMFVAEKNPHERHHSQNFSQEDYNDHESIVSEKSHFQGTARFYDQNSGQAPGEQEKTDSIDSREQNNGPPEAMAVSTLPKQISVT